MNTKKSNKIIAQFMGAEALHMNEEITCDDLLEYARANGMYASDYCSIKEKEKV